MPRSLVGFLLFFVVALATPVASAQTPNRDQTWNAVTTVTLLTGAGTQLLMPRVFYSDPEVTVGWKARWHVSVLAPVMTLTSLTLLNEYALKDSFKGFRPGCNDANQGQAGCRTYGMMSTHTYGAFSALGHGTAVFLIDTMKWNDGRFNVGGFVGDVGVPLVAGIVTAVGRVQGNWETGGQVFTGGAVGLASGFALGAVYAVMARPECGYSGSLVCW